MVRVNRATSIVSPDPESVPTGEGSSRHWQESIRRAIRCPRELLARLGLTGKVSTAAEVDFPVFVPEELLARIEYGNPSDPLLMQVLPTQAEEHRHTGFSSDPLREEGAQEIPGLIRKYNSRALLILTGACGVHCRYCFRREFPYSEVSISADRWEAAIDLIRRDPAIREVILSGGDPLMLVDEMLASLTAAISKVSHVKALRIHSRLPVVIPHRIERTTLNWMSGSRLATTLVIHANHAQELNEEVELAARQLRAAGVTVLNQAVLLRGVNDSFAALAELSWRLLEIGIIPYYLHQLDRVVGAGHFEVSLAKGISLVQQLRNQLPGHAVPRYALEEAGQPSKTILL